MSAVTDRSIPIRNFRVRRRRYGDKVWLILDNYYHEVDSAIDAVWLATDGASSVAEIAARLGMDEGARAAAVRDLVALLVDESLMSLADA